MIYKKNKNKNNKYYYIKINEKGKKQIISKAEYDYNMKDGGGKRKTANSDEGMFGNIEYFLRDTWGKITGNPNQHCCDVINKELLFKFLGLKDNEKEELDKELKICTKNPNVRGKIEKKIAQIPNNATRHNEQMKIYATIDKEINELQRKYKNIKWWNCARTAQILFKHFTKDKEIDLYQYSTFFEKSEREKFVSDIERLFKIKFDEPYAMPFSKGSIAPPSLSKKSKVIPSKNITLKKNIILKITIAYNILKDSRSLTRTKSLQRIIKHNSTVFGQNIKYTKNRINNQEPLNINEFFEYFTSTEQLTYFFINIRLGEKQKNTTNWNFHHSLLLIFNPDSQQNNNQQNIKDSIIIQSWQNIMKPTVSSPFNFNDFINEIKKIS